MHQESSDNSVDNASNQKEYVHKDKCELYVSPLLRVQC